MAAVELMELGVDVDVQPERWIEDHERMLLDLTDRLVEQLNPGDAVQLVDGDGVWIGEVIDVEPDHRRIWIGLL